MPEPLKYKVHLLYRKLDGTRRSTVRCVDLNDAIETARTKCAKHGLNFADITTPEGRKLRFHAEQIEEVS